MCAMTGMPAPDDAPDLLVAAFAALELHGVRAGLLHEPHGGVQGLLGAVLVGAERHVGDDERALHRARHGARERDQLVDRHRQRGLVAEHVVARRVADEQEVDAGLVEDARGELVVAREPRDLDALALRVLEVARAHALRATGCRGAAVRVRLGGGRGRVEVSEAASFTGCSDMSPVWHTRHPASAPPRSPSHYAERCERGCGWISSATSFSGPSRSEESSSSGSGSPTSSAR